MKKNRFTRLKLLFMATSIQKKILMGMISISFGVIIFISLVVGANMGSFVTENNIKDSTRNTSNIGNKLNLVFEMAEINAKSIASNTQVQSIITQTNRNSKPASFVNKTIIKEELINIIGANNIIDAAVVYDLRGNIFTSGIEIFSDSTIISVPEPMTWIDIRNNIYKSYNIGVAKNDFYVITLRTPIFSYRTGQLLGYLELYIPEVYIRNLYALENLGKASEIFILNNKGVLQSSSTKEEPLRKFNKHIEFIEGERGYFTNKADNTLVVYEREDKMGWYILEETELSYFYKARNDIIRLVAIIGILGLVCSIIFSTIISKSITRPLHYLTEATKSISHGNFNTELQVLGQDEVGILTQEFNTMLVNQNELIHRLVEEQTRQKEYALELIQDQVKPHFLYNTLDNICALAELDKKEELIDMILDLSTFYRGVLSKGETLVTIEKEVSILISYLKILNVRYKNKFTYDLEWDESLKDFVCPKLLLQPIVENAIYHGVKLKKKVGHINISIYEEQDFIIFSVKDDGVGMEPERIHEIFNKKAYSFGIKSTDERVKLYYGKEYGLNIDSSPDKGTVVTIKTSKKLMD